MAVNLPKFWICGVDLVVDTGKIVAQISNLETAQELLPIWTDWGIEDRGVLIHSLGVTYLTLLGNRLNYVSVTEVPAPCEGKYDRVGNEIRSDAVWFDRITQAPIAIAEFERYSGKEDNLKLENKVKNLYLEILYTQSSILGDLNRIALNTYILTRQINKAEKAIALLPTFLHS